MNYNKTMNLLKFSMVVNLGILTFGTYLFNQGSNPVLAGFCMVYGIVRMIHIGLKMKQVKEKREHDVY
jgi:hypothetical protein